MKTYTLLQVQTAFWKMFHEYGEIWFCNIGTDRENDESTHDKWEDFLEKLEEVE